MNKTSYYIINSITLYRLLAAPLLIFLAFSQQLRLFSWLLAISFFTDSFDGYLARRFKVTSIAGSKLDSVADDLTIVAAITGMVLFRQDFLWEQKIIIGSLLLLFLIQTIGAFTRYGRISSFHTYAAKTAAVFQGLFLIQLFFFPEPDYRLFYAAAFITAMDLVEEIILLFLLPGWEADVKGLYWVLQRKRTAR